MTEQLNPDQLNSNPSPDELNPAPTPKMGTENGAEELATSPVSSTEVTASSTAILTEEQTDEAGHVEEDHEMHELDDEFPNFVNFTKAQLLKTVEDTADKPLDEANRILKAIKPFLDAVLQEEYNAALARFIEEGGEKDDFNYQDADQARDIFNRAQKELKHKRAEELARQEAERAENLKKKEAILEQIKLLTENEETEGSLKKLKELQNEWKLIRNIPKDQIDRLWESYNFFIHKFYDRLSIFNELKDLDRRKNLDHKIELIQKAAELALEPSAKRALILLKKYQEDWRNIGPVPQESNEDIWNRFKHECDKIYEMIKSVQEQNQKVREENLLAKKELLARALQLSNFSTTRIKEWFEQTNTANQLMEDWKKIGMVPLKYRESVWNEFRNARNLFYANKNNFFKTLHAERNANLKIKTQLCEQAEAIAAQPVDYNRQTEDLKKLQDAWKKSGPVHEKISDAIWKRFRAACDTFFEKKAQQYSSQQEEQKQNLLIKKEIVQKLESLLQQEESGELLNELKNLQDRWNHTGFVPMNEKEKINKQYSQLNDQVFQKFREVSKELRDMKDKSHLEALLNSPNGDQKVRREEKQLMDRIRGMRSDISTWENNVGFFTKGNSKTENPMVKQIEEKIAQAHSQIAVLETKLKNVRALLKQQTQKA